MTYTLYKNPIQTDTLMLVRYLHFLGKRTAVPSGIVERSFPSWVVELPSIETHEGARFVGLEDCIAFLEALAGLHELWSRAQEFALANPEYRVSSASR